MKKRFGPIGLPLGLVLGIFFAAGTVRSQPLTQVIEGAKKEGAVSMTLRTGFTPKSMARLEQEIKEKFGVELKIRFVPNTSFPKELAAAMMELKSGAIPSFDLMTFSTQVPEGLRTGLFERVEWRPLISKDTNPEVVHDDPALVGAITYFTGHLGLMYYSEKFSVDRIPKTLGDLADPKWQGRVGIHNYPALWATDAYVLGKEKVLSDLRTILKNGAILGIYADMYNRYLLGEIHLCLITSAYLKMARDKGVSTGWRSLDYANIREYSLVVRTGAKHPNAAKLVALYLGSPAGAKFTFEEAGSGNLYYPGNYEHDIRMQNKSQGIPEVFTDRKRDILEFSVSKEFERWEREIKVILDTGGQR